MQMNSKSSPPAGNRNFHPSNSNFINSPNRIGSGLITQTMIARTGSTSLLMIHVHFSLWEEKINRRQGRCLQIRGAVQAKRCNFLLCLLALAIHLAPGDFSIGLTDTVQDKGKSFSFFFWAVLFVVLRHCYLELEGIFFIGRKSCAGL